MGTFFSSLDVSWGTLKNLLPEVFKSTRKVQNMRQAATGSGDAEQKVFEVKGCATGRGILWYWEVCKGRCFSSALVAFWNRIFRGVFESTQKVQNVRRDRSRKEVLRNKKCSKLRGMQQVVAACVIL